MKSTHTGFLLAFSVGLLVGCSAEEPQDVASFVVGQCFDGEGPTAEDLAAVPVDDCSEPHDYEVFYQFEIEGDDTYPGEDAIRDEAQPKCFDAFVDYLGPNYDSVNIDFGGTGPDLISWLGAEDRTVTCFAYEIDFEKLTGSVKGMAQ